jgi:tyrosyl-tRNA synthetase
VLSGSGGGNNVVLEAAQILGQPWSHILSVAGIASSKSEAARMVQSGAIYIASKAADGTEMLFSQVKDARSTVEAELLMDGKLWVRSGKWKVRVIEVKDNAR